MRKKEASPPEQMQAARLEALGRIERIHDRPPLARWCPLVKGHHAHYHAGLFDRFPALVNGDCSEPARQTPRLALAPVKPWG